MSLRVAGFTLVLVKNVTAEGFRQWVTFLWDASED